MHKTDFRVNLYRGDFQIRNVPEKCMKQESSEKRFTRRVLPFIAAAILMPVAALCYKALNTAAGRVAGDFFYPYLQAVKMPVRFLSDKTLLFCSRTELAARVEHLSQVNSRLAAQASTAIELMRENENLRRQLKLKPKAGWRYINAQVLLRDPLRWQEHLTIDRGSRDGIYPGCAVIIADFNGNPVLAGVVSTTGRHTSVVNTVYNPLLRISGCVGGRAVGFLNGSEKHGSGRSVPIDYLPADRISVPGEAVMTTGFEHRIPGGIKIGELSAVSPRNPLIFDNTLGGGTVDVSLDPNLLRFVTVAVPDDPDLEGKNR